MTVKGKGGKPLHFKSLKELQDKLKSYFEVDMKPELCTDKDGRPVFNPKTGQPVYNMKTPTIAGLCIKLDFADRRSIYDYIKRYKDPKHEHHLFAHSIKKAVMAIEEIHEANLLNPGASGSIFWLKNRDGFKWLDKHDVSLDGEVGVKQMGNITKEIVKKGKVIGKETLTFNVGEPVKGNEDE